MLCASWNSFLADLNLNSAIVYEFPKIFYDLGVYSVLHIDTSMRFSF